MKHVFLFLTLFAASISAHAELDLALKEEMKLKVSEAYSRCAAYYEIAARVVDASDASGAEDAGAMKRISMAHAVAMATEFEGKRKAKKIARANFAKAIEEMHNDATSDPEQFKNFVTQQRKNCRRAVNDPPGFVELTLSEYRKQPFANLPIKLTAENIRKYGRPVTEIKKPAPCAESAEAVNIPLDDVLDESGLICVQHHDGVCDSERLWMSYEHYIETLHPDRVVDGYAQTVSTTFQDGKMQSKRTIVGCLASL